MNRGYQYDYSLKMPSVYDIAAREKKAETMLAVFEDYFDGPLCNMQLLDVGSSTGIIDNRLANKLGRVVGIDIDEAALSFSKERFSEKNLQFMHGDAMSLEFEDNSFDIIVCSHVYEHVPDANKMMTEIRRVLKPGGICYFAGNVRLMINEPHYNLPFLSLLPRPLAHQYLRLTGKGRYYHEKHFSYGKLKKLVSGFRLHDYTKKIIEQPVRYRVDYMLKPGSAKARLARLVATHLYWLSPCIWVLEKVDNSN